MSNKILSTIDDFLYKNNMMSDVSNYRVLHVKKTILELEITPSSGVILMEELVKISKNNNNILEILSTNKNDKTIIRIII